jgi:hypothetical protein
LYRFKTFDSRDSADDLHSLEARVNAWMDRDRPRIRLMCQTPIGNHVVLSFVFEVVTEIEDQPAQSITAVPDVFQETMDDTPLDPNEPPPLDGKSHLIQ